LGLFGENPMIPAPPKLFPVSPVPEVAEVVVPEIELLPDPVLPVVPLAEAVLAAAELSLVPLAEPVAEVESLLEEPELMNELPSEEAPVMVFPPLDPIPARVDPAIGCPKKPITVGALFWPNWIAFHSSLPVVGSTYFLRRKRILLVFTSASTLGG